MRYALEEQDGHQIWHYEFDDLYLAQINIESAACCITDAEDEEQWEQDPNISDHGHRQVCVVLHDRREGTKTNYWVYLYRRKHIEWNIDPSSVDEVQPDGSLEQAVFTDD